MRIETGFASLQAILLASPARCRDQKYVPAPRAASHRMRDVVTVDLRHPQVEDDDIRVNRLDQRQRARSVRRGVSEVTAAAQESRQAVDHVRVVIHDQYPGGATMKSGD